MYKRKRVYGPKRVMRKRRRYARRRRPYGSRRVHANTISNNKRAYGGYNLVPKRMKPRSYRNILYRNTLTMARINAKACYSTTIASPANVYQYTFLTIKCFDNFMDSTTWTNPDGAEPPSFIGKMIMRGGLERLEFNTEADECMDMCVSLVWVKPGASRASASAGIDKAAAMSPWTSTGDTLNEGTREMKRWKFNLTRGQGNYIVEYKPRIKAYDYANWNNNNDCMFWYVWVGSTVTGQATDTVTYVKSWNCTIATHWKVT